MARRERRCPEIAARCVGIFLLACVSGAGADDAARLSGVEAGERLQYRRRAQVRETVDVASRDLYHGPRGRLAFDVDEEIVCDFVAKPIRGWSEKFFCRLDDGRVFKIKYVESDRFKEPYGEVLG